MMSEIKHVQFTTISDIKRANGGSESANKPKDSKTIRLELSLFDPTADNFPEFNYAKLIYKAKKKHKKAEKKGNGFVSDEAGEDDEISEMAKEFERKYGSGTSYGYDRGAGYDDEDSFIDNTDAYDEIIPDEVEAERGGFYINSGQLEFKQLSNFERPDDVLRMPKPKKKRALSSSSSECSESEAEANGKPESNSKQVNGHVGKKQKTTENNSKVQKNAKSSLHKEKENVNKTKAKDTGSDSGKIITIKDMLRAQRDSLRKKKQARSDETDSGSDSEDDNDDDSEKSSSDTSRESIDLKEGSKSKQNGNNQQKAKDTKLPDDLPDYILQDITSLKAVAKENGGKIVNFFEAKVADLLLKIDVSSRIVSPNARNQIFKHLEEHIGSNRQSILVNIKKIRIKKEDNKVKKYLLKFKNEVNEMLQTVNSKYDAEKAKYDQTKSDLQKNPTENKEKIDALKVPKKKFTWNDSLRSLLNEINSVRRKSYNILKPKNETEDEFLTSYLKSQVLPIFGPAGLVKVEDLHKELDRRKRQQASKENKANPSNRASTANNEPVLPHPTEKSNSIAIEKTQTSSTSTSTPSVIVCTTNDNANNKDLEKKQQPLPVTKKSSDHSIMNIISSPPKPNVPHSVIQSFDEEQIVTHVISADSAPKSVPKAPTPVAQQDSSDSSDVEIIDEYPLPSKSNSTAKTSEIKPEKYRNPLNNRVNDSTSRTDSNKDSELDVNQIMKEIKELQEMQYKCNTNNENNNHKVTASFNSKMKDTEQQHSVNKSDDFLNYQYSSKYHN